MNSRRRFLAGSLGASALLYPVAQSRLWVPLAPHLPRPKFYFGQEVTVTWENIPVWGRGDFEELRHNLRDNRATIVGMAYEPTGYNGSGWHYWHRWLDFPECPYMVGEDEGDFFSEDQFEALS